MACKLNNCSLKFAILLCIIIFVAGCSGRENKIDTFYVELVNFNNDTLKKDVSEKIFGKASFYKNDKLEIISLNYVTDNLKDPHYFLNIESLNKNIEAGTRKIRVELNGDYSFDSIKYSLQKYIYKNEAWQKTSDMGLINAYRSAMNEQYVIIDFGDHIQKNVVLYTYD